MSDSFVTPWTVTHKASLSTGFPRQKFQSGLPLPSPGDIPDPGIEPTSPALEGNSLPLSHQGSPASFFRELPSRRNSRESKQYILSQNDLNLRKLETES